MIDTPIRRRDPLKLAAWLCRYANDIGIDPADEQQLKDAAVELRAWHDAKGRIEAENVRLRIELAATEGALRGTRVGMLINLESWGSRLSNVASNRYVASVYDEMLKVASNLTKALATAAPAGDGK